MRIAITGLRGIPANYGGFETFAEELAPRLVDRGHQVAVYGRSNYIDYAAPFYKGVAIKRLPTIRQKYLDTLVHTALSAAHCSLTGSYDVVLMVNAANAPFALFPRLAGIPVVLNVDGIERLRRKWGPAGRLVYRLGEWLATRIPDRIVADARIIADYYSNTYGATADVIAYGADTMLSPPGDTLRRFALRPREYVLYVSRLEPENNADKVIRAYRSVEADLPLMIVGDAPYSTRFKQQLKALAAEDSRVVLAGAIYGPGYRELLSNACIYVQATEVGGTHPALIEAMAAANCVVANDVKEHAEVLNGCGVLYAKNDVADLARSIQALLQSDQRRAECARLARERAIDHYSWQHVTDAYEALFFDVVERKRSLNAALTESRALDRK